MTSTDVTTLAPCNVWIEWRPYADDCTERRAPYALLVRGVVYGWWERRHLAERARAALLDAAPVKPAHAVAKRVPDVLRPILNGRAAAYAAIIEETQP